MEKTTQYLEGYPEMMSSLLDGEWVPNDDLGILTPYFPFRGCLEMK